MRPKIPEISKLKVDGSNYLPWKFRVEQLLRLNQLEEYLDIALEVPDAPKSSFSTSAGITTETLPSPAVMAAYNKWMRGESEALAYITFNIEDEVLQLTMSKSTARETWEIICRKFEGVGAQSAVHLLTKVFRTSLSDESDLQPKSWRWLDIRSA